MNKVEKCDQYKLRNEIFEPDPRSLNLESSRGDYFENFHKSISTINLELNVPKEIIIQFETAKNVLLYSYYSYRMSSVANLFVYSVLEKAIKVKYKISNPHDQNSDKNQGLRKYMKIALKNGWIHKNDFFLFDRENEDILDKEAEEMLHMFVDYRNDLSHSPEWLNFPWEVVNQFIICQNMINHIFNEKSENEI